MNTNIFVVYSLTLTLGMSYFYAEVREYFSPIKEYKASVAQLENKLQVEKFKHLKTSFDFEDFRNHVATLLPKAIKEKGPGEKSYPLRTLASVVQKGSSDAMKLQRAKAVFDEAKRAFREKKYEESNRKFSLMIKDHPYSPYIPEALFLLVEGHFLLREFDQSINFANKMIDLYPESELTGYAMIRLGKIYEFQDRHEEAIDIYKTVLKAFPMRDLANVASDSLRTIEL